MCISGAAAGEYGTVLLLTVCTTGPVCSAEVVSCCSAFRVASGGHRGDIWLGHAKLSHSLLSFHSRRIILVSFCLSTLSALSSAQQQTWQQAGCSLSTSDPLHFRAAEQVHILPQGQNGHYFLNKAQCWHNNLPPSTTFYVWICNIYMTVLGCINAIIYEFLYMGVRCILHGIYQCSFLKELAGIFFSIHAGAHVPDGSFYTHSVILFFGFTQLF